MYEPRLGRLLCFTAARPRLRARAHARAHSMCHDILRFSASHHFSMRIKTSTSHERYSPLIRGARSPGSTFSVRSRRRAPMRRPRPYPHPRGRTGHRANQDFSEWYPAKISQSDEYSHITMRCALRAAGRARTRAAGQGIARTRITALRNVVIFEQTFA